MSSAPGNPERTGPRRNGPAGDLSAIGQDALDAALELVETDPQAPRREALMARLRPHPELIEHVAQMRARRLELLGLHEPMPEPACRAVRQTVRTRAEEHRRQRVLAALEQAAPATPFRRAAQQSRDRLAPVARLTRLPAFRPVAAAAAVLLAGSAVALLVANAISTGERSANAGAGPLAEATPRGPVSPTPRQTPEATDRPETPVLASAAREGLPEQTPESRPTPDAAPTRIAARDLGYAEALNLIAAGRLALRVSTAGDDDLIAAIDEAAERAGQDASWRLDGRLPPEVASALAPTTTPDTAFAGGAGPEAETRTSWRPLGNRAAELSLEPTALAAMLRALEDSGARLVFEIHDEPLGLEPAWEPDDLTWWNRPAPQWTRRGALPIVVERMLVSPR